MADVLALVDDLFFLSKLNETARHVGVTLQTVNTGEALVQAAANSTPKLVLVDLNARQGALEAVERLGTAAKLPQDGMVPVIAFLSHVQTELAEKARAAGCQQVLPRSKFTAELAQILQQAKM